MKEPVPARAMRRIALVILLLGMIVSGVSAGSVLSGNVPKITITAAPTTPVVTPCPVTYQCMWLSAAQQQWGSGGFEQYSATPCGYSEPMGGTAAIGPVPQYCVRMKTAGRQVTGVSRIALPTTPPTVLCEAASSCMAPSAALTKWGSTGYVQTSVNACGYLSGSNGDVTVSTPEYCYRQKPVSGQVISGVPKIGVPTTTLQVPVQPMKKGSDIIPAGQCKFAGKTDCNGNCVDLTSDVFNCGACGNSCDYGYKCINGGCSFGCDIGLEECNYQCVDLKTDPDNCGDCGNSCDTNKNEICSNGLCECKGNMLICDMAVGCSDVDSNPKQCGSCNNVCAPGQTCDQGQCKDPYIRLLFVPLNWQGDQTSFDAAVGEEVRAFTSAIPLKDCPYRIGMTNLSVTTQNFNTFTCIKGSDSGLGHIQNYVDGLGINRADYDVVVGVVQNSPCPNVAGWSNLADTVWIRYIPGFTGCAAHELGHIYGLADEYCSTPDGSADCRCNDGDVASATCGVSGNDGTATGDKNWLDSNLGCSPLEGSCCSGCTKVNYNICCKGNQGTVSGRCVMSYLDASPDPRSFCQHCTDWLATVPQLQCHSPPMPLNKSIIDLSVTVHSDDTVSGARIILNDGRPTPDLPHGIGYKVAVLDAQGAVVKEYPFAVYFDYNGPRLKNEDYSSIKLFEVPVNFRIPYSSTMKKLTIYHGDKLIFSQDLNFCNNNGVCDSTETHQTCSGDCPLNQKDSVCIPVRDSVCDPDCLPGVDPDCANTAAGAALPVLPLVAGGIVVIVAGAAGLFFLMKKK